jgi:hypothetical protein
MNVTNLLDAEAVFGFASAAAMTGWLALALSPAHAGWAPRARLYAGRIVPLALALVYAVLVVRHWGPGGFGSLAAVRELFGVPGLLVAGWLHYLAFDLFVGAWIAERAGALGLPHLAVLPLLALTFLFGPAGLLAFSLVRMAAMRRATRSTKPVTLQEIRP